LKMQGERGKTIYGSNTARREQTYGEKPTGHAREE